MTDKTEDIGKAEPSGPLVPATGRTPAQIALMASVAFVMFPGGVLADECDAAFQGWVNARNSYMASARASLEEVAESAATQDFAGLRNAANCAKLVAATNEMLPNAMTLIPLAAAATQACGSVFVAPTPTPEEAVGRLSGNLAVCANPPATAPEVDEDVYGRLKKIIIEHLGVQPDKVTLTAGFVDDLGCDSLDLVELTMSTEEEFGVAISDHEAMAVVTIGDAVNVLTKNFPGRGVIRRKAS